jgi:hypothetical protein
MMPQSTPTEDLLLFQAHFDQLLNPRGRRDWFVGARQCEGNPYAATH